MPQSSQNLAAGELSAPHFVQRFDKALPHSGQNFLPLVLSVPHLEQSISSPVDCVEIYPEDMPLTPASADTLVGAPWAAEIFSKA